MPTKTDSARRGGQRRSLDRRRVLETSLAIVDEEGLEALTMRRLGAELGVDAMSVYGRVDGKDALLDGLVELLWSETAAPTEGGVEWTEQLRSFARSLRAIIRRHPHAAPLLFRPNALPESALVAFDGYLEILRDAGFDEPRAAEILRALIAYGRGYGMAELSCFVLSGPQQEQPSSPQERLVRLGQRLPRGISPRLARVAAAICAECDPDSDFEFGLDLILWGVRSVDRRAQASEQKTHIGGGGIHDDRTTCQGCRNQPPYAALLRAHGAAHPLSPYRGGVQAVHRAGRRAPRFHSPRPEPGVVLS